MIGLFDSGLGGLTVAKALITAYPEIDLLYLGDTARAPYGSKGKDLIEQFAIENTQWLIDHGATAIGIACNTASVAATEILKKTFPQIPIFNVIDPVIAAIERLQPKTAAVLCTRGTLASGIYEKHIHSVSPNTNMKTIACPLFVPLVEEGLADSEISSSIAKYYLSSLVETPPEYLILGCTHYPFLQAQIEKLFPSTKVFDGPSLFLDSLPKSILEKNGGKQHYYFTDLPKHTKTLAIKWVGCGEEQIQKA